MADNVRNPQQKRSIDKKNRIIQAGYELFASEGYFNTNTAQIAKKAGVSTGIVYGYFRDKRDILLETLDIYVTNVFNPVFEMLEKIPSPLNFKQIVIHVVDMAVETHRQNAAMHRTLHSLSATDQTINDRFMQLEEQMTKQISERLRAMGYNKGNVDERVHLAMETTQSYAHECAFDQHSYINYADMRQIVIKMLVNMLEDD